MLTWTLYFNLLSSTLFPLIVRIRTSATDVEKPISSIHSASIEKIYNIPMKDIARPLPSILDENKVQSLMKTIKSTEADRIPPIDVLWYQASDSGNNYFFSMGGCHRWEAHQRLNSPTIPAKLVRTTSTDLRVYFGSSLPLLK